MNFDLDKDYSLIDTSVLPNDIFTRIDDDFFSIVKKLKEEELTLSENNETQHKYISNEFIDKHPLLKSLIKWYQQNDSEDNNKANRYTESIKKFAICLYVLGSKQCYEFVRLNMPGSIPNLTTLGDSINKSNMTLAEAEFKFDSLQQFQSGFGFCSEDTTGVIPKVEYNQLEKDLSFPIHHKHKREHLLPSLHQLDEIDTLDIQQLISNAYDQALHLVKHSKILDTLNEHKINCIDDLSNYIFDLLNKNSRMINYSFRTENNTTEEFGLDEENDDNDVVNYAPDDLTDEILFDSQNDAVSDDDENILNSTKSDLNGIGIVDNINPTLRQ
ncbi:unnamed protein product, partial [Rotaria sordida]